MYSTCTFCHASLGKNEVLEHFPVGARVAFDQSRGRLWAVCPACRQWNLSPLETRWEAIEEGERLYHDARRRVATDQIGMAKLADGTELVRIGAPLRPEFAAWRYGERFTTRWRRGMLWGGVGVAAFLGTAALGPALGLTIGGVSTLPMNLYSTIKNSYDDRKVVVQHRDEDGPFILTRSHVRTTRIIADADSPMGWSIEARSRPGVADRRGFGPSMKVLGQAAKQERVRSIRGADALHAMRAILPEVNRSGGRRSTVNDAVRWLETKGGPERIFVDGVKWSGRTDSFVKSWELGELDAEIRLALEMAAHEETERRAMEGELAVLEAVWREAEEVAAIADELTLPDRVTRRLERLIEGR